MVSAYEDLFGSSDVGPGTYIILAVVAFMMLRATPAFLRMILPNFRIYPLIAGGIAFWWLILSGKFLLAFGPSWWGCSSRCSSPARRTKRDPVTPPRSHSATAPSEVAPLRHTPSSP